MSPLHHVWARLGELTPGLDAGVRRVRKRYSALLCGKLEGAASVELPLTGGQTACTHYAVKQHSRSAEHGWLTTIDLWPHTGKKDRTSRINTVVRHSQACVEEFWKVSACNVLS